ncbi:WD40 repeat-like protein [Nadsonia fulvescens var. elongata DSM 6958]|uniref:WD40 repeat-like protein n=1 Tax=Nadsonia fulvescens var. elongata DSM 6958 TaxID=857566 RepID=A0A1E3PS47_9ASCO|nr:WD40 repeat-like protein [Nadsonia fulvescens var. elongata DSM 6958]
MSKDDTKETKIIPEKDQEELDLENAVFGDFGGFDKGLRQVDPDNFGFESSDESASEKDSESDDNSGESTSAINALQDDQLFFVDDGDVDMEESDEDESGESESDDENDILEIHGGKAAWVDSDDENLSISLTGTDRTRKLRMNESDNRISGKDYTKRLRAQFQKIYPVPKWALPERVKDNNRNDESTDDSDFSMNSDSETATLEGTNPLAQLLQTAAKYSTKSTSRLLPPSVLDISRLKDANHSAPSHSAIQTLSFHPTHPLLLSSGYDRTLRMYHVDGKTNPVATTLHARESPFQTAQFHSDGRRVFAAGRRRYMYIWDIETGGVDKITRMYGHEQTQKSMEKFYLSPCGRFIGLIGGSGWVNILSTTSGQWIAGAKVEGVIADIAWGSTGEQLTIVNTSGEVWEWSTGERKFINRWVDLTSIGVTSVALGGVGDRWCAIGGSSGIVNVYDRKKALGSDSINGYKSVASLDQLTTTISSLEFSPDGQMLAMGSRAKKDAFRIAHIPSFTVFKNWPTSGTPLGRVTSSAYSPGGEMLCAGNEAGKVRLWKLNHY